MKTLALLIVLAASGCGAMLNSKKATVNGPPGTLVNGAPVPTIVSKRSSHTVDLPDGRRCVLSSGASGGYIVGDLFLPLIGIIVDAATGAWKTLDADDCPGVTLKDA